MFVLAELRDTVTIPPIQFRRKMHDAVTYALNKKFANKVSRMLTVYLSACLIHNCVLYYSTSFSCLGQ